MLTQDNTAPNAEAGSKRRGRSATLMRNRICGARLDSTAMGAVTKGTMQLARIVSKTGLGGLGWNCLANGSRLQMLRSVTEKKLETTN